MKFFGKWRGQKVPVEPVLDSEAGLEAPQAEEQCSRVQNPKILVVDDNPVVLKAFEMKLRSLGFQVLTAGDGAAAVATARSEHPNLIILDINFPPDVGNSGLQWNGFNIMQWLRRFQDVAAIPVIIITSDDPAKVKDAALSNGAIAFFQKPINQQELLVAIYRTLGAKRLNHAEGTSTDSALQF